MFGLHGVITIGNLHFTFCADLFASLFDQSLITLPALFLQGVHRKADAHQLVGPLLLIHPSVVWLIAGHACGRERDRKNDAG